MQIHLLFITSHYFYQLTVDALERLGLDCRTTVVPYDNFSHIPEIYRQYQDSCDTVFISGVSAKRVLEAHCPDINKPLTAFQVDSDALHRDILRFAVEHQSLNFNRVAMDFLLPFDKGYSVADFLAVEDIGAIFTGNQEWMHDERVRELGAEKLILNRIVTLWEQGEIDCVICMYSGIIPRLRELGIPCRCPFLSDARLKQLIREVLIKLELQRLHENHPAVVQVFPARGGELSSEQGEMLESRIRAFLQTHLVECVVNRSGFCCTLITSMRVVRFLTDEFSSCRLCAFLSGELSFPVAAGYGIGTTAPHAMNNAQIASREAKLLEKSFVMDSNGNLVGPLDSAANAVITQASWLKLSDAAKQASLSAMTLQKIMLILQNRGSDKLTTQELAEGLGTTVRNANRIIRNLLQGGFATPVYTQMSHSRGRPVQVYSLQFHISR